MIRSASASFLVSSRSDDFAVGRQRRDRIDGLPIDFGRDGGLGQTRTDIGRHVDRPHSPRIFPNTAVGKFNFEHKYHRLGENCALANTSPKR